jgi:hypothetical protein
MDLFGDDDEVRLCILELRATARPSRYLPVAAFQAAAPAPALSRADQIAKAKAEVCKWSNNACVAPVEMP